MLVGASIAVSLMACTSSGQTTTAKRMAVVNGVLISEDEVRKAAAGDLENIELKRMQSEATFKRDQQSIYEKTLSNLVDSRIIEAEAKKRGVTAQSLIATEIDAKTPAPTEQEVTAFYEANRSRISVGSDEALRQVRTYLRQQNRETVYEQFVTSIRKEHKIETFLQPLRTPIATEGFPTRGPATAPVTIVEFSDFECPYCASVFPTLKLIEANYGDRVRVVFRQFPLTSIHPHAQKAAEASLCAAEQKKFWELHDALFQDNRNLDVASLKQKASTLKLDMNLFNSCLDSSRQAEAVKKDIFEGVKAGVTGTPAMFINGRFLNGAQPYAAIAKVIDEELQLLKK